MKKYLSLYKIFLKISFRNQLQYRTNFLIGIFVELFWVASHLLYVLAIWKTGIPLLSDLREETLLLFVGTYLCLTGILMGAFFTNLSNIPVYIHSGKLDLYLVKPASSQFLTSLEHIDYGYPISDISIGLILIMIGWNKAQISVNPVTILGYLFFFLLGILWMYDFQMLPVLMAFIFIKINGVFEVFYGFHDLNKVPMLIYGRMIQLIGTFVIPIFPMVNFPVLFAAGKLSFGMAIYGIAGPIAFFVLVRALWKFMLKKYTSANG